MHHPKGALLRLAYGESVAQQVEHNTFNVGVLGSSPSGFTKIQTVLLGGRFFAFMKPGYRALTCGYLLAETLHRPAGDSSSASVRFDREVDVRAPAGSPIIFFGGGNTRSYSTSTSTKSRKRPSGAKRRSTGLNCQPRSPRESKVSSAAWAAPGTKGSEPNAREVHPQLRS